MSVISFFEEISKRRLVVITLSFCLGVTLATNLKLFLGIPIFFILLFSIYKKESNTNYITKVLLLIILIPICLGFLSYSLNKYFIFNKFKDLNNVRVELKGTVDSEPQVKPGKIGLVIKVNDIKFDSDVKNRRYQNGKILAWISTKNENLRFEPGRKIILNGELTLPQGMRNPMGFDYRKYLATKKVSAIMYAKESDVQYIEENINLAYFCKNTGYKIKNAIVLSIKGLLPEKQAALLSGMLIGYTDDLDEETEQQFRDSGLSHIMAVSGSNVAFIVFPLFFLLRKIGLKERTTAGIIIPILVLFIFVTGFSASVARAVIMAIIILMGKFIYREADTLTSIAASVLLLLILNPFMLFEIGFQLSYGATLGIIFFYRAISSYFKRFHFPKGIVEVLGATISAQIGVLPISAYYFNRVSIISLVSNLLVVPMTELITIIGFIMVFLSPVILIAKIVSVSNFLLLSTILKITEISANLPYAAINVPTPRVWQIIIFYLIALYYLYFKPSGKLNLKLSKELAGWGIILGLFIVNIIIPKGFQAYFLDVGQGDSCLIKTNTGKTILIDGGDYTSKVSRSKTMGDSVVFPFLMDKGIMKLDMVIASHGHDDHFRGLVTILNNMKVDNIIIPNNEEKEVEFKEILQIARKKNINVYAMNFSDKIHIDRDTKIDFLYPNKEYTPINSTLNNGSLVLKLIHKDQSILLCGDIEAEVEKYLVDSKVDLSCDVLKLSHHGSSTSSTMDFLKATNARVTITSVGRNNFGHPSSTVLYRVSELGMKNFRTDESGALEVDIKGKGINIKRTVEN